MKYMGLLDVLDLPCFASSNQRMTITIYVFVLKGDEGSGEACAT